MATQRIGGAYWRPPLVHMRVDAARHAEHGDVAVPDLAVVADLLDDVVGPLVVEPRAPCPCRPPGPAGGARPAWCWSSWLSTLACCRPPNSSAVTLGEVGPAHDVEPLVVALADHVAERLLADDLRQQHEVVLVGLRRAERRQRRAVGRVGVAAAGDERRSGSPPGSRSGSA